MAKRHIFNEYDEAMLMGAVPVSNNKFCSSDVTPMKIRSIELYDDYLEEGAEITIPKDYHVFSVNENDVNTLFLFVEVKYLDGTIYHRKFLPNSLAKHVFPIDETGQRLPKVKTNGEVATWYAEQDTVDNAMRYLAGKTISVSKKDVYKVRNRFISDESYTSIYSYEWKKETGCQEVPSLRKNTKTNISVASNKQGQNRQVSTDAASFPKCIESSSLGSHTHDNDITAQFKHFSLHSMPFQESIVDVKSSNEIEYSNRIEWLSNLYLITESGHHIQCKEICKSNNFNTKFNEDEDQPYEVFLDGVLRISWVYAYNAEYKQTLSLIKKLLGKGKLTVTRDGRGGHHFFFSDYGYSWI